MFNVPPSPGIALHRAPDSLPGQVVSDANQMGRHEATRGSCAMPSTLDRPQMDKTVLDFLGQHRREFRPSELLEAMKASGLTVSGQEFIESIWRLADDALLEFTVDRKIKPID